jgi:DNA-binding transcriptional regulator LsrR (DeoR family)
VARLHYEADLSQIEIARRLGVSAATVSRLLRRARAEGIVRIEIRAPRPPEDLADSLAAALGLGRAVVAERQEAEGLGMLAGPVGALLAGAGLARGAILAVGWGRTIMEILQAGLAPVPGVITVAATGGMQQPAAQFQTNEFARIAAEQMQGTPRFIHAPYLPSREAREAFLGDPTIRDQVRLWDRLDAALVGIGLPYVVDVVRGGTAGTPADPALARACGDVLQHFYALDGTPIPWEGEARLIAVSRDQLRRTRLAIGVAVSPAKVPAIIGAARSRLINALVTDLRTAEAILDALAP